MVAEKLLRLRQLNLEPGNELLAQDLGPMLEPMALNPSTYKEKGTLLVQVSIYMPLMLLK